MATATDGIPAPGTNETVAAGTAPVALPVSAMTPVEGSAALEIEVVSLAAAVDRLNWRDETAVSAYHAREKVFLDAVERLPLNPEHTRIRAKAVNLLHRDNPMGPMHGLIETTLDQQSTDQRLICQVLGSLWGAN